MDTKERKVYVVLRYDSYDCGHGLLAGVYATAELAAEAVALIERTTLSGADYVEHDLQERA